MNDQSADTQALTLYQVGPQSGFKESCHPSSQWILSEGHGEATLIIKLTTYANERWRCEGRKASGLSVKLPGGPVRDSSPHEAGTF